MRIKVIPLSSLSLALLVLWCSSIVLSYYAVMTFEAGILITKSGTPEHNVYAEHGILENIQTLLLAMSCIGFVLTAMKMDQSNREIPQFMALLMVAFIVRELGFDKISKEKILFFAGDGRLLYGVPLVGLALKICANYKFYFKHLNFFLSTRSFQYLGVSALCYGLLGGIFDKSYIEVAHPGLWEESFELAACLLLFVVGCRTMRSDLPLCYRYVKCASARPKEQDFTNKGHWHKEGIDGF